ncbi:type VII secretion protein EccCa [Modestobacter sp. I12A-02628]|uniref:Type VII secretion protein EccCa n=1 Tax=Goekera deserti TaxID=2497753 RepID=A0A7K3WD23_9ACTN|nr:type VII secretion protein EccCa [Goekera deserti]MPQ97027.1 type VII secretion protein EccCa [Goekera deserti]NDI46657.1 type VII secretion protein EccCa [Goekera deserti]NEL54226.1 type VII secretion protein EccCa [Goekera deserti]
MATVFFRRPPRVHPPPVPVGDVLVQPPPELPTDDGANTWLTALPALSGLGSVAYMFAGPANPVTYVAGSMFLFSSLAMVGGSVLRSRSTTRGSAEQSRRDYLRHLRRVRRDVRGIAAAQRELGAWRGPAPDQLWTVAGSARLWERRPADEDFGLLRIGTGDQQLMSTLVTGESAPLEELDPLCATALRRFVVTHATVPDSPLLLAVRRLAAVRLSGSRDDARALAAALVCQAAAFHAPGDLRIAVATRDPEDPRWSWVKWLPHAHAPDLTDHVGPVRLIDPSLATLTELLGPDLARRPRFNRNAEPDAEFAHLLLVLDGALTEGADLVLGADGLAGVTVLDLDGHAQELAARHGTEITLDERAMSQRVGDRLRPLGTADAMPVPLADALAHQLAGARLDTDAAHTEEMTVDQTLPRLLDVPDAGALDLDRLWRPRPVRDRLRFPLGVGADRSVLALDVKESALDGMGPHGLVIGATGSGKSELLRTLVLAAATTHGPDVLNLVLVDFKGGATFAGMSQLPHVAAVITNLQDDLSMVDRMREALAGEMNRRQEVLRDAGNMVSVRDYERARLQGAPLAPLPTLFLVVDEFSELLSQKPEFAELFAQIGRLGRSLGLHLLLASQRLDEGRLRGLESHLSYRIGLRTFSESESRTVLGVPDAYSLPSAPGHGYLKADTAGLRRFRAAYVSGPHRSASTPVEVEVRPGAEVREFTARFQAGSAPETAAVDPTPADGPDDDEQLPEDATVLGVMVRQMVGRGVPAHQVWLPPLDEPDPLDALWPDLAVRPGRGFGAPPTGPDLQVPVGVVDKPFEQRRDPLVVDLAGSGGHVAVVGGPRSGKSTVLRTLVASLALRHTPAEVQVYAMDFSGGGLFALAQLPHVGAVAGRQDTDVVRRIVAEVEAVVEARETRFRELDVDSMATYRQSRADGRVRDDPFGDVFVLVDGWGVLRQDHADVEERLTALASRALTYGVHLVLSANRWLELRMGLRDLMGTKLELKLGDALDSEVDRKAAQSVPAGRPGRGVSAGRHQWLAALPRIDGRSGTTDLAAGVGHLVRTVREAWTGPGAPPVRLLPVSVRLAELPRPATGERVLVVGVEGNRLTPVAVDPRQDFGMLVLGDAESGKTGYLRTVARQVLGGFEPAEAKIVLVDYRRSLLGEFGGDGVLSYAATAQQAVDTVAGLLDGFARRMPGPDVTPEQLRTRSWWTGPEVFVLVDDYDLVATGTANPLLPLVDHLAQARDLGLHVHVTRRAGGAARALADPFLGRLRELGTAAVVLSAPREEGVLLGVRPAPARPGRGTLVHRRYGTVPVQLVRTDAAHDEVAGVPEGPAPASG